MAFFVAVNVSVARVERSETRGFSIDPPRAPGFAALYPGYAAYLSGHSAAEVALVGKSLEGTAAKVWIDENEEDAQRALVQGVADIRFERWADSWCDLTGLVAPVGTRIELKGGWLNGAGNESLDPEKFFRSRDIHGHGHT